MKRCITRTTLAGLVLLGLATLASAGPRHMGGPQPTQSYKTYTTYKTYTPYTTYKPYKTYRYQGGAWSYWYSQPDVYYYPVPVVPVYSPPPLGVTITVIPPGGPGLPPPQ